MRHLALFGAALMLALAACSDGSSSSTKAEMADCCKKSAELKASMPKCCATPNTSECCKAEKKSECCKKAAEISAKMPECCKKAEAGNPPACCKK
jgi:hypothetical protein